MYNNDLEKSCIMSVLQMKDRKSYFHFISDVKHDGFSAVSPSAVNPAVQ